MSKTAPVILILGAGPNIGQEVARAFAAKGYKVACVSRSLKEGSSTANQLNITADMSDPKSVVDVFDKVKAAFGIPSVVVHNCKNHSSYPDIADLVEAAGATMSDLKDPLSLSLGDFTRNLNINTVSAFVAAQQAVSGFQQLPDSASKTFIYTGNILNSTIMPPFLDLGITKSATAHMIQYAAAAYKDQGYKYAGISFCWRRC